MTTRDGFEAALALYEASLERLIERLEDEPPEDGLVAVSWSDEAERLLDERQRLEEQISDLDGRLDASWRARCAEADDALAEQLFRLSVINDHRRRRLAELPLEARARAFWYAEGASLPAASVTTLGESARVVAAFPAARREFDALVRAEAILSQKGALDDAEARPVVANDVSALEVSALVAAPSPARRWAFGVAAAAVATLALGGFGFAALRRAEHDAEREKAALRQQLEALQSDVDARRRVVESSAALHQSERLLLEAELAAARAAAANAADTKAGGPSVPLSKKPTTRSSAAGGSSCEPGDAMCGDL